MTAKKESAESKPITSQSEYERVYGVKMVEVGKTPPEEYLQQMPVNKPRVVRGKVTEHVLRDVVRIIFGKNEEVDVVVHVGHILPKVGTDISAKITNGSAVIV